MSQRNSGEARGREGREREKGKVLETAAEAAGEMGAGSGREKTTGGEASSRTETTGGRDQKVADDYQ